MAIRRFTEDCSVISSLPDVPSPPAYNASILKAKFDESAQKIKAYINDTLIPDIENEAVSGVTAVKKHLLSYTAAGTYQFDTAQYPSVGGVYDIVLIGGGGGGSINSSRSPSSGTGGGAGAVNKVYGAVLDGVYSVTVGSAGSGEVGSGVSGGATYMSSADYSFLENAGGGQASSQTSKIGKGGGIGGGDSVYDDGTVTYGRGGDNEYGRGTRGGAITDSVEPSQGYGAGGWSTFAPKPGAVLIYGYVRA